MALEIFHSYLEDYIKKSDMNINFVDDYVLIVYRYDRIYCISYLGKLIKKIGFDYMFEYHNIELKNNDLTFDGSTHIRYKFYNMGSNFIEKLYYIFDECLTDS